MTRTIHLAVFAAIAFVLGATYAHAQIDARTFAQEIETNLEDAIPPISTVIPGYNPTATGAPSLIVADLETKDLGTVNWGKAIGQILRWDMAYNHRVNIRMPDVIWFYDDSWSPTIGPNIDGKSPESISLLAARYGIDNALMGSVAVDGNNFTLELALKRLPTDSTIETIRYSGALETLPDILDSVPARVYSALGLPADSDIVVSSQRVTHMPPASLRKFATALAIVGNARRDYITPIWKSDDATALIGFHYMESIPVEDNVIAHNERLDEITRRFPDDRGLELAATRKIRYDNHPAQLERMISRLKKLLSNSPQIPGTMQSLCNSLATNNYSLDAIAVCREGLRRDPGNYHAWWNMGWSLLGYAWNMRGYEYSDRVTPKGKRMFKAARELAGRAIDQALSINSEKSQLWVAKIKTIAAPGPELMRAFNRAVQVYPYDRDIYTNTLNYT